MNALIFLDRKVDDRNCGNENVFREPFELAASELDAVVAGGHGFHFTFALHVSALHENVIVGSGDGSFVQGSFNGNGSSDNGNNNGNISIN